MISRYFIERRVLSTVIGLVVVLLGLVAALRLPISQYPNIVPPTIQVTASYPGASAKTIARTVGLPIEQQVNGVPGMLYMQSTSTDSGAYTLNVTFQIGSDVDQDQVLVQNRVSAALAALPSSVQTQNVVVRRKSTSVLSFISLTSPDASRDSLFLSNYASINLVNELARVPGVGDVSVMGAAQYAMRVWLDPGRLQSRGLTPEDVVQAVQQQSREVPMGQIGAPPMASGQAFQYTLNVAGRFSKPEEFGDIILKTAPGPGGQITRLRDVARVELGAKSYAQDFRINGAPAIGIGIYLDPAANALGTQQAVEAKIRQLATKFPPGVSYSLPFDTTKFVTASVDEVYKTLIEAALLVLVVMLVFLQDWRAMMVPAMTIPVTIIGSFAALAALGFSINISTLLAVVLAIGIVVDDAIVVVESVAKGVEEGLSARDAAIRAMTTLIGPIVGITLVLMSVFLPAAFLPGLTGQLYAQFALLIAATALLSALIAITLNPMQSGAWLRQPAPLERRSRYFRAFEHIYSGAERRYARLIHRVIGRPILSVCIALFISAVAIFGIARIPSGFLPTEDQGYFLISVQLPSGASIGRTEAALREVTRAIKPVSGVEHVVTIAGLSPLDNSAELANAGLAYVVLKDWDERKKGEDLKGLYQSLSVAVSSIRDASVRVIPPPAIQGIGSAGGFSMQVELKDGSMNWQRLQAVTDAIVADAVKQPEIRAAFTTFRADAPQYDIGVDRAKAETLQVPVGTVFDTLSATLGSAYAGQFDRFGQTYQVYIQADGDSRAQIERLSDVQVRGTQGQMVPLGSLLTIKPSMGPSLTSLYDMYPSSLINGVPAKGYSSGQAMRVMEKIAARHIGPDMGFEWTAMSYQEKAVGGQIYMVAGFALLLVYFVLAAQYESWLLPLTVLAAVPMALTGPALVLTALGLDNNLYTQIGVILLVALSAKNAILIVEMAREYHNAGKPLAEAAIEAATVRFRPILMTSIAFILGVLPLVTASGAGANARIAIGLTTLSGMISSTCFAVVFIPAFFVALGRKRKRDENSSGETAGHTLPSSSDRTMP
jgi:HAE1 family hydrophobic/amphiphilic exporter-1